jgi:hypothetical protein
MIDDDDKEFRRDMRGLHKLLIIVILFAVATVLFAVAVSRFAWPEQIMKTNSDELIQQQIGIEREVLAELKQQREQPRGQAFGSDMSPERLRQVEERMARAAAWQGGGLLGMLNNAGERAAEEFAKESPRQQMFGKIVAWIFIGIMALATYLVFSASWGHWRFYFARARRLRAVRLVPVGKGLEHRWNASIAISAPLFALSIGLLQLPSPKKPAEPAIAAAQVDPLDHLKRPDMACDQWIETVLGDEYPDARKQLYAATMARGFLGGDGPAITSREKSQLEDIIDRFTSTMSIYRGRGLCH